MVACAKVIVFLVCFVVSALSLPKHYKIVFLMIFERLIFRFFCQTFKVNELATSRSITWPHFWPKFGQRCGQVIEFSHVFF